MLFKHQIQLLPKGAAVTQRLAVAVAVSWQGTTAGNLPAPCAVGHDDRPCCVNGLRGASQRAGLACWCCEM